MNIRRLQCFFSARSCSTSSLEICGTQGRASRKKLRLGVKPLISLILIIGILFSFSVSSYAATTEGAIQRIDTSTIPFTAVRYSTYQEGITDSVTRSTRYQNGILYNAFNIPAEHYFSSMSSDKIHVRLYTYDFFDLKINTEYNLKLSYYIRYVLPASVNFYIRIYDNTDNVFKTIDLYTLNYTQSTSDQTKFVDFNFILSKDDVPTGGFKCKFCFDFEQSYKPVAVGADNYICLSQYITLEDLDDNSGWFQKIIDAIKSLPEKIGQFFTNLGTQIGIFFTELGNKVTELKNSIKGFFDNLINNLKQWFKDVGNWFSELGDRIQGFFVDLYNDIIDGLKSLFIPEDGYFESKKAELETFFSEHFGIVYTAGSLSIDVLKKFTSLKPPAQSVLHVPAWQMQLPWESDKIITIVPAMDVNFSEYINSSGVLHTFYKFYRAFITVVIIFMVVNYAKRKFDYVFGKDGEGVE